MITARNAKRKAKRNRSGFTRTRTLDARKRIGPTVYDVKVFTKEESADTVEEKVLRLVRNDLNIARENVKIKIPQTERLPERSSQ